MYSRYNNSPEKPLRIPENYSGYAFAGGKPRQEIPRQIDVAKPTPAPPKEEEPKVPPSAEPQKSISGAFSAPDEKPHEKEEKVAQSASVSLYEATKPKTSARGFPFGHGIGFDELLLIGLIVLLHGSEGDSDVVLWLILLLFMG